MRTTIDIDDTLLNKAIQLAGISSKKRTIEVALHEYIRMQHRQQLANRLANYPDFALDLEKLGELRDE
jgi:Arc/MetJ family transcription regulator